MTALELAEYAERVKAMSRKKIALTLANHEKLVASDRWAQMDEKLKADLAEMVEVLKAANGPAI